MYFLDKKNKTGFATLFIVLLLGSISLAISLYISSTSFWVMKNSIEMKDSTQTQYAVDSCGEQVLEIIRNNRNTSVSNDQLQFDGFDCTYSISNLGGQIRLIEAEVIFKNFTKRIEIKTSTLNPITLEYWIEK